MLGLLSALIEPLGKIVLKAWLGDEAQEVGGGLLKFAMGRLKDRGKATDAVRHAKAITAAVVDDLEKAMGTHEGFKAEHIEAAASELGETIRAHLGTAFLVSGQVRPKAVAQALLQARPPDTFYGAGEPEREAYLKLVQALAPRLCKIAPSLPDYTQERDSSALQLAETPR